MPHDLLQDALKTALKTLIQNTAEANGDLTGNKIAVKIAGNSKTVPSKTEDVWFEKSIEVSGEKYISSGKKTNYWWT